MEERRTRTEDTPTASSPRRRARSPSCHTVRLPFGWTSTSCIAPPEIGPSTHLLRAEQRPRGGGGDFHAGSCSRRSRGVRRDPAGADPPPCWRWSPRGGAARHRHRDAQLPIVYIAYHVPNSRSRCAGARGPLDGPVGGGLAAVYAAGPRPPAGSRRGRGLLLLLGRSKLFWFWATDAGTDAEALEQALLGRWCV